MIVTEHYAVCDVCSERIGPFDTTGEANERIGSWYSVSKGVIVVQCHTAGCAKIALDDADELFKHSSPIGCFPPVSDKPLQPRNAGVAGTYMERMASGGFGADLRGLTHEPTPDYRTSDAVRDSDVEESQSGKHGEKEQ
jgi:hypothetical protein